MESTYDLILPTGAADWQPVHLGPGRFWQSPVLAGFPRIRHVFTGVGFNLSERTGRDVAGTPARRQAVCESLGLPYRNLVSGSQVHAAELAVVDGGMRRGPRTLDGIDGLVTSATDIPLLAKTADCPLVLIYEPSAHVLGVAHSGWRSTVGQLPTRLAAAVADHASRAPESAVAVLTPCAGPCCYEVQDDVLTQVREACGAIDGWLRRDGDRCFLDLELLIASQLRAAGLRADAIHLARRCTICDRGFYSYRRDGANTGHGALIAGLSS